MVSEVGGLDWRAKKRGGISKASSKFCFIFSIIITFELLGDAQVGSWLLYTIPHISDLILNPSHDHIAEELYPWKFVNSIIFYYKNSQILINITDFSLRKTWSMGDFSATNAPALRLKIANKMSWHED